MSTRKFCVFVTVVASVIVFSSGLECFQCRTNQCSHQYCREANSLPENTETVMNRESWQKLSTCPAEEDRITNEAEYVVTCPKIAIACGRTVLILTTTTSEQIVHEGSDSSVSILGSGVDESKNSSVIVYGCVMPNYKPCYFGYSVVYTVASEQKSNSGQGSLTHVIVTNTKSVCCRCQHDRCNEIYGTLSCDTNNFLKFNNHTDGTRKSGAEAVQVHVFALLVSNFILKMLFYLP